VLVYGRDRGVARERADALATWATERPDDPFDVAVLNETDLVADPARLESELSALSMMGGRRLVRVRLFEEKAAADKICAEALEAHIAGELNAEAFLLIEAGALGRDSKVRRAAEKAKTGAAALPCYEDDTGDLARLTREALAQEGVSLNSEALELFASRLPSERGVARREIERLVLFLGPGSGVQATAADLEPFLGVEPDASLADAAQDAFGGRLRAAQAGLRRAAQEGEGGPAAVRAMSFHLARLQKTLILHQGGAGLAEAAKSAGVFWKNEREFLRQARAWPVEALNDLHTEMLSADQACKRTGSPDEVIAERLVLSVAGRARRLGL
jgi:DNA polymerase-3 subunit delta